MTIPNIGSLDTGTYVSFIFQHSSWSTLTNAWTFSFDEDPNLPAQRVFLGRRIIFCLPRSTKERGGEFTYPFLFGAKGKQLLYQLFTQQKKNVDAIVTTRMSGTFVVGHPYKNPSFGFLASWVDPMDFFFWNRGNSSTDFGRESPPSIVFETP